MCEGEGMGVWWPKPEDSGVESPGVEGLGVYNIQVHGGLRCGRHNTCQKLLSRTVGDIAGVR